MVEWTKGGPYSFFMESIHLEISPHVPMPVIHLWTIFHPFVMEFQMLPRSSLWAVGCGLIVRPWALGFEAMSLSASPAAVLSFRSVALHVPALLPCCRVAHLLVAFQTASTSVLSCCARDRYTVAYVCVALERQPGCQHE